MHRSRFTQEADPGRAARRAAASGFTLMESLVLLGILIILLSIFIPYAMSLREKARRSMCEQNLHAIFEAMQAYAHTNNGNFPRVVYDPVKKPDGYVAFTGTDDSNPFAPDSNVQPSDITASLWLLVRENYVADTRVFICPSSNDSRDLMTDVSGNLVLPRQRGNFGRPINLSYSYADPFSSAHGYRLDDNRLSGFALMADKNPGATAAEVDQNAPATELAKANSQNHDGAGQNVLFAYGGVDFKVTPYCGIGNDNIYTARAASVHLATQPTTVASSVPGVVGPRYSPVQNDDSYLVPTAEDVRPSLMIKAMTTAPATKPAPATSATSITSTRPANAPQTATMPTTVDTPGAPTPSTEE